MIKRYQGKTEREIREMIREGQLKIASGMTATFDDPVMKAIAGKNPDMGIHKYPIALDMFGSAKAELAIFFNEAKASGLSDTVIIGVFLAELSEIFYELAATSFLENGPDEDGKVSLLKLDKGISSKFFGNISCLAEMTSHRHKEYLAEIVRSN